MLVEAEVRNELLELAILVLELLQAPQLAHTKPAVQLLPAIKGLLADTHSAQHLGDRRARLGLLQRERNLLLGELRFLHGSNSLSRVSGCRKTHILDGGDSWGDVKAASIYFRLAPSSPSQWQSGGRVRAISTLISRSWSASTLG